VPWTLLFLLAGSVVGFWFVVWVVPFVIPVLLCCCLWCLCVFLSVSTFFQCFFIFTPLWSCVGQSLFGRIKIVSVTVFFLMKNVLSHGREKKKDFTLICDMYTPIYISYINRTHYLSFIVFLLTCNLSTSSSCHRIRQAHQRSVHRISKPRVPRPAPASPLLAYPLDACDAARDGNG
jgi:hypothetical protein